jgi:hypothetical protein
MVIMVQLLLASAITLKPSGASPVPEHGRKNHPLFQQLESSCREKVAILMKQPRQIVANPSIDSGQALASKIGLQSAHRKN